MQGRAGRKHEKGKEHKGTQGRAGEERKGKCTKRNAGKGKEKGKEQKGCKAGQGEVRGAEGGEMNEAESRAGSGQEG